MWRVGADCGWALLSNQMEPDLLSVTPMQGQSFKSFLVLAFVLFFGGIFTAGIGLGLFDGVPASFLIVIGVLLAVLAPATALIGASLEESPRASAAKE